MKILPEQKPGIIVRKIGNEIMLYDTNREIVHILNATAETIWNSCNGNTKMDELEDKLKESYSFTHNHDVQKDIEEIMANFSQLDLVNS